MLELDGLKSTTLTKLSNTLPPQADPSYVRVFVMIMLVFCNAEILSTHLIRLPYRSLLLITQHT